VVDNTFFSVTDRDTYGTHYYSEIINTKFIENRTEFIDTIPEANNSTINVGVAERWQHTLGEDDFFFEPANVWDLSASRSGMVMNSIYFPSPYTDAPVPGWPGRYATPGVTNDDTNSSTEYNISPFAQTTWKLTDFLNFIAGVRSDLMRVTVADPFTPGFKDSISVDEVSYNGSLVLKITPTVSAYATYNFSENYTGALANGGGFTGWQTDAFGNVLAIHKLDPGNYNQPSKLYEAGIKDSLLNKTLYASAAIFQQTRQQKAQGQPSVQELFNGFEAEANYQPDKHFYATVGYSLLIGSLDTPIPFQGYSTNQVPNGPPSPNTAVLQSTGKLRVPGYPEHTGTVLFSYLLDNGFGASVNAVLTSSINNDYQGYLVIPFQKTIDGSLFYKTKAWEARISMTNITNEHNWTPAYPTYGLESIVPDPGFELFGTIKYKY
jgi:hypothetical protein